MILCIMYIDIWNYITVIYVSIDTFINIGYHIIVFIVFKQICFLL